MGWRDAMALAGTCLAARIERAECELLVHGTADERDGHRT
jgi:hypothetical protein